MKATKKTNEKDLAEIHIILNPEDAELLQTVALQFAEHVANCKKHRNKMRGLAMKIDKVI